MDDWWNENSNFYPFEESPEEEPQEPSNPFKPISVTDRFEQMDTTRSRPAVNPFTPPKPGQPYGQGFSSMPPLAPARPFSQIQQGDLYGYTTPDGQPGAVTNPLPFAGQPNPFGEGVGASPLGASTPDTLPTFTQRTGAVKRSDLHQTTQTGPVPIWSIDDDPIPAQSVYGSGVSSPYPGFPPLPQSKPDVWQPPVQAEPVPAMPQIQQPELDWSLPAYPEADPNWQPPEDGMPETPDFLKEKATESVPEEAEVSPIDKLNIPAYLRVQPLPKRKPRPAPEAGEQPTAKAEQPTLLPIRCEEGETPAADDRQTGADEENGWFTDAIYMRPGNVPPATGASGEETGSDAANSGAARQDPLPAQKSAVGSASAEATSQSVPADPGSQPDEPSPDEEIIPQAQPSGMDSVAPVAVTPGNRRSRRSRMAAREESPEERISQAPPADTVPAAEAQITAAQQPASIMPAEPSVQFTPEMADSPVFAAFTGDAAQTRKRRRRSEQTKDEPAEPEDARPFVPPVGAEDPVTDPSAARPVQDDPVPMERSRNPVAAVQLQPFVRRGGDSSVHASTADIDGEDDWQPFAAVPADDASVYAGTPLFSATDSPFGTQLPVTGTVTGENTGTIFDADSAHTPPIPYPDSSFTAHLPPVPEAPVQEWSPFGSPDTSKPDQSWTAAPDTGFDAPDAPVPEWSPFGSSDALQTDTPWAVTPDSGAAKAASGAAYPGRDPAAAGTPSLPGMDSPFAANLPPIPDAPVPEWSPFGTADPSFDYDTVVSGTQSFPAAIPYGDELPLPPVTSADSLFGDEAPPTRRKRHQNSPAGEQPPETDDLFSIGPANHEAFQLPPDCGDLFNDSRSNLSTEENPVFGTSSYDAGDMPNPSRGHLSYEVISEFDTLNRLKATLPEEPPQLFEPEPVFPAAKHHDTGSMTGPLPQSTQRTASPLLSGKDAQPKPSKPPINPVRLVLLLLAIAMAAFCIVSAIKMLVGYVQNTEDWTRSHEDFINQHGMSMSQAGEMVQLPQDGSTFAPTGAPAAAATPAPSAGQHDVSADASAATPTPVLRTRLSLYPDNPLRNPLDALSDIRKEYPEVIGRLVIPDVLDEWIVSRNNTYYLNHNYRGTSAEGGAVFMDAACTLDTPPENLHLRASGSVPGKTFHTLWRYKTEGTGFIYNAEVAHVTTLYEEAAYLLYAVIETSGDPANPDYFNYASHPTFATDEEMMNYLALARQHSLYTFPTDVQPGDRLLTLSTVSGADGASDQATNLVLIFRSVR